MLGRKSRFYQLNLILSRELDKRRRAKEFALFGGWLSSEVGKGALVLNVFNELVKYGSYKYVHVYKTQSP